MRTSLLCPLILIALCCFALPRQAKADVIIYDSLRYDNTTGLVYGYASTALSYPDQYYYDAGVSSVLADQYYNTLDQGSALGGSFEVVNTQTFGAPGMSYNLQSSHYIGFYFYYCDYECYYYDYYGYSFYGGDYPEYDDFKPVRFCYVGYDIYDLADTYLQISTPPRCSSSEHTIQIVAGRDNRDITNSSANSLIGARTPVTAIIDGSSAVADGTYNWSYQGGQLIEIGPGQPQSKIIYWLSQGPKTVTVQFIPTGENCAISASTTINVVLPTVISYAALQANASVHPGANCGDVQTTLGQNVFQVGCGSSQPGIKFDATVQAPDNTVSALSDSKVKFVQFFNAFATAQRSDGSYVCAQTRSDEFDPTLGWWLDKYDPYGLDQPKPFDPTTGTAVHSAVDSPAYTIDAFTYFRNRDYFEMYLVYIAGDNDHPRYQQALSMIPWDWSGEIFFSSPGFWSSYTAYPPAMARFGVTPNVRVYHPGDPTTLDTWSSCSGPNPSPTPDPTPDPNPCYRYGDCGPLPY